MGLEEHKGNQQTDIHHGRNVPEKSPNFEMIPARQEQMCRGPEVDMGGMGGRYWIAQFEWSKNYLAGESMK